jgi:phage terminase large subunit-like protein
MSLSHAQRATEYAKAVVAKEVPASKWIILACQRHLDDLKKDWRWHYDDAKVNRVCAFIERLPLDSGLPFILQPFQIWIVASLMGWVDAEGLRKYIEALILIPKGNGKSPLAAALALWFAFFDGRPKAEVYCGAVNLAQAHEVFLPARNFCENQPAFAKAGITALKKSIFSKGGSKFVPVIGKGRHGARPYLAILDELHQAISSDLYGTFKTGCNKTVNSLMLTLSTAGVSSTESPCYQLQVKVQKALDGSLEDDRIFGAIYCADDSVDWTSEKALLMANPNLGISNDAEKIRLAIKDAERTPAHANNIKAMHLNIWSTAAAAWMNMASWKACYDPDLTEDSVIGLPCVIGSDLASTLDLSACVRLFRDDSQGDRPHYYALCRAYLPEARVNAPENGHFRKFVALGCLTATPGSSLDYSILETDALADIAKYKVSEFPFDPRYADDWSLRIANTSGVTRIKVPPCPAELSPAMKELEGAIADGRFHHDGNQLLTWCLSNLLTRETAAGNYTMPDKQHPESKIDAAMALILAMNRARLQDFDTQGLTAADLFMFA